MHALKHYSNHLLTTPTASSPDAGTIGESRTNWAGYNANSASNGGDAFTAVETQFTVPAVQANSKYPSYGYGDPMDTFWAGLGGGYTGNGDGTTYINQAGVETVSQSSPSYYFTTELAGSSGPVREGPVIGAYDTAYAEVWYTDASGGNAYVNFYLENDSSGAAQHFISATTFDEATDSFECAAEWPQIPQHSAYLPDFGNMSFSNCAARIGSGTVYHGISGFNYYQDGDWCFSGSTPEKRVQYPSALDDGFWTVYWQNSGAPC